VKRPPRGRPSRRRPSGRRREQASLGRLHQSRGVRTAAHLDVPVAQLSSSACPSRSPSGFHRGSSKLDHTIGSATQATRQRRSRPRCPTSLTARSPNRTGPEASSSSARPPENIRPMTTPTGSSRAQGRRRLRPLQYCRSGGRLPTVAPRRAEPGRRLPRNANKRKARRKGEP